MCQPVLVLPHLTQPINKLALVSIPSEITPTQIPFTARNEDPKCERVAFSNSTYATKARIGPTVPAKSISTATYDSHNMHDTLWVTPPTLQSHPFC